MGNNFIFTGDDGSFKKQDDKEKRPPARRRGRRGGKNRKQVEDDLKKKWKEDEEKKLFKNKKIKEVWHQLVLLSLPIFMIFWYLAIQAVHVVTELVQRWLDLMRNMIK